MTTAPIPVDDDGDSDEPLPKVRSFALIDRSDMVVVHTGAVTADEIFSAALSSDGVDWSAAT
jgi:hypothetical protein